MISRKTCRLCGGEIEPHGSKTARLTLCDDCRARILARYTYRLEHHVTGREKCCLVCGRPIPKEYGSYTTCSKGCRTLLASVTAAYRKQRFAQKGYRKCGVEHYVPPTRCLSPLGKAEQEARERGISYGYFMASKKSLVHKF